MAIIVSKGGKDARRLEPSEVKQEDYLQQYIHANPEAIPMTELKDGAKLLILAREFPTISGPIDALGVDSDGDVYIVETKLYKNPDKRLVIAQMLDYGAALWKGYQDFSSFTAQVEATGGSKLKAGLDRTLAEFFGLGEEEVGTVLENMRRSLSEGRFQFIVLMDRLEERLRTLITFVNANSNFRVLGCELEFYDHDGFEILIPRLYGAEVPSGTTSSPARQPARSSEELRALAEDHGVADLYNRALSELEELHDGANRTRTNVALVGFMGESKARNTIISIYPDASCPERGLALQIFVGRACKYFSIPREDLMSAFGPRAEDAQTWAPNSTWYFDEQHLNQLISTISEAKRK